MKLTIPVHRKDIHIYQRSKTNKNIYRCIHPTCNHYRDKALLEGKLSECPKCHGDFLLELKHLRYKTPVCLACSKSPKAVEARAIESTIVDILQEVDLLTETNQEEDENKNAAT